MVENMVTVCQYALKQVVVAVGRNCGDFCCRLLLLLMS